ncbi:hypothetical protein GC176_19870 [bacterium]|nr:hypothetical protein [bacterium]
MDRHNVAEQEVWAAWKEMEQHSNDDFRGDIRNPLPEDLNWVKCSFDGGDASRLWIISSDDWRSLNESDFRLPGAVAGLNRPKADANFVRHRTKIVQIADAITRGGSVDSRLIAVTNCLDAGPVTFIEGNHRAVAYHALNQLGHCEIYLGIHPSIQSYCWARKSFEVGRTAFRDAC